MTARGLLLTLDYSPARGGIARLLDAWTQDTDDMIWRVLTVTDGPSSERVVRTSGGRMAFATASRGIPWLRQADERFVVAGHPYLSSLAVLGAGLSGARSACVAYGRELVPHRAAHRLALAPLAAVQQVIAISEFTAELAAHAGTRRSHLSVLNPVLRAPWIAERAPHRLPERGLRLVTISRLAEGYKNLELVLRLCAVLHPLGVVEKLTIIGGGPRLPALRMKVASLGLDDLVDLVGHISDAEIPGVLACSHVGLFASRQSLAERGFEGFGLVVHELAAAGLPVLVGDAAGAPDAALEPWARLVDPDDLWAWVEAVEDFFANEERRLALGDSALRWAAAIGANDPAQNFARRLLGRSRGAAR